MKARRWTPQEMAVARRYVGELMKGRYAKVTQAATDCFRELERLRRSAPGPARRPVRRTRVMTMTMLGKLTRNAGRVACQNQWTRQEMRVLRRHAQALVHGVYCDSGRATAACHQELARLHLARPLVYGPRGAGAVRKFLPPLAHKLGWSGAHSQLHPIEERLLERYKRAFIRGEFPSAKAAARVCREELARLRQRAPTLRPKTLSTLRTYIHRRSRGLGKNRMAAAWSPPEDRVASRYARALGEGRYRTSTAAAADCLQELSRLKSKAVQARVKTRTAGNVAHRIRKLADRLPVPRPNGRWTAEENRILRHFTHAVLKGGYAGPTPAFEPFYSALNRHYARLRAGSELSLGAVGGRTKAAAFRKLDLAVQKLGWHGRPAPRWTAVENRASHVWLRWYDSHRPPGRRGPISQAAEGLQEELDQLGYRRTVSACKGHLREQYRRLHGAA